MRGVVWAVSIGHLRSTTKSPLPLDDEIPSLAGSGCFAFLFGSGQKGGYEVIRVSGSRVHRPTRTSFSTPGNRQGVSKSGCVWRESGGGQGYELRCMRRQEMEECDSEEECDDDDMKI